MEKEFRKIKTIKLDPLKRRLLVIRESNVGRDSLID